MSRSTFVGIVVLALLAAGVYWVRSGPSAPGAVVAPPGIGDEGLPDVTRADGSIDVGDVRITLDLTPQPPVAFATFRAHVRASSGGAAVALEGGTIWFEMTMPMGDHRYSLVPVPGGAYEAEVVLPLCPSGNRRWYATVEGTVAGRPVSARFRLDLTPPGR